MPALSPAGKTAALDLSSVDAARATVTAAAATFEYALSRPLTERRAKVAQKRLLELIRGPAAALKHVHDARPGGRVDDWGRDDVCELLRLLGAGPDDVPPPVLAGGELTLVHARDFARRAPPYDRAAPPSRLSAVVRARVAFHLALLARLGDWRRQRDDADAAAAAAKAARAGLDEAKRNRAWGAASTGSGTRRPPDSTFGSAGSGAAAALALSRGKSAADDAPVGDRWVDPWAAKPAPSATPGAGWATTTLAPSAPPAPSPPRRRPRPNYSDLDVALEVVGGRVKPTPKVAAAPAHVASRDDAPVSPGRAWDAARDDEEIVCELVGSAARDSFSLGPGRALLNAVSARRLQAALHDDV